MSAMSKVLAMNKSWGGWEGTAAREGFTESLHHAFKLLDAATNKPRLNLGPKSTLGIYSGGQDRGSG